MSRWLVQQRAGSYREDMLPGQCFRCGASDHWIQDCPVKNEAAENEQGGHMIPHSFYQNRGFVLPVPRWHVVCELNWVSCA